MLNEKIVNIQTGEEIIRPYTEEELAQVEEEQKAFDAVLQKRTETEKAKAELLTKLGITADEAKLLLA